MKEENIENKLLNLRKYIIDGEPKVIGPVFYRIKDENGNQLGSSKRGVIKDFNDKEVGKVKKKALSPTWSICDSRGNIIGIIKRKRTELTAFFIEAACGGMITSINKGESGRYQFHSPDGKSLLASFGWEMPKREQASEKKNIGKKISEAAKPDFRVQGVLELYSEELQPLLALSLAIQALEVERMLVNIDNL